MTGSSAMATGVALSGKDLLEPRLATLCMNAGVDEDIMNKMGTHGLRTCALVKGIVGSSDEFREMMREEPFNLSAKDFPTKVKIGQVTTVYENCLVTTEVASKADAERILQIARQKCSERKWKQL